MPPGSTLLSDIRHVERLARGASVRQRRALDRKYGKGKWRKLKPGMVLTVEPGCYIRPADNVPKAFWNIGVRIEDDVLVTARGREGLTADCPKSVKDVEAAVLDS